MILLSEFRNIELFLRNIEENSLFKLSNDFYFVNDLMKSQTMNAIYWRHEALIFSVLCFFFFWKSRTQSTWRDLNEARFEARWIKFSPCHEMALVQAYKLHLTEWQLKIHRTQNNWLVRLSILRSKLSLHRIWCNWIPDTRKQIEK